MKFKQITVIMLTSLLLVGCGTEKSEGTQQDTQTEQSDSGQEQVESEGNETENETSESEQEQTGGETEKPSEEAKTSQSIGIYYIDGETGELTERQVEWERGDNDAIWRELQNSGILSAESQIAKFSVDESEAVIYMDVNNGFGDYLRTMGTSGEKEVLVCIYKTYSQAYNCDTIVFTEEGGQLESGHRVIDRYMGESL